MRAISKRKEKPKTIFIIDNMMKRFTRECVQGHDDNNDTRQLKEVVYEFESN